MSTESGHLVVRAPRSRAAATCTLLGVAAALLAFAALSRGTGWDSPSTVLAALAGEGERSLVITQWRAPRAAAALVFGAALGLAGAIFQNLTRNPLGSPDIIGIDAGAYTGALIAITVLGAGSGTLAASAVGFGLVSAAVVYVLSFRAGFSGLRLIVIGVAVNAMLTALNSWIVLRAQLDVAIAATGWSAGSLNGVDWDETFVPVAVIAVLATALAVLSRAMHQAALGDEVAVTTGVRLGPLRLLLVLIGVGLTATVTGAAGPIVFVALAAPQIGRRLAASAGVALLPAALTGAVLLIGADLAAQLLPSSLGMPVGVVTTVLGGAYLIWLLVKEVQR